MSPMNNLYNLLQLARDERNWQNTVNDINIRVLKFVTDQTQKYLGRKSNQI
jgi:hypothetical protein